MSSAATQTHQKSGKTPSVAVKSRRWRYAILPALALLSPVSAQAAGFTGSYQLGYWTEANTTAGYVTPTPTGYFTDATQIHVNGKSGLSLPSVNNVKYMFTIQVPIGVSGTWSFTWSYSSSGGTGAGTTNNSAGYVLNSSTFEIVNGASTIKGPANKSLAVTGGDKIGFYVLLQSPNTSMIRDFFIRSFSAPDIAVTPVPEPDSFSLFAAAVFGLGLARRHAKRDPKATTA